LIGHPVFERSRTADECATRPDENTTARTAGDEDKKSEDRGSQIKKSD